MDSQRATATFRLISMLILFTAVCAAPSSRTQAHRISKRKAYDDDYLAGLTRCAQLTCMEEDLSGCQMREVIVWQMGDRACKSCEYCLDWPFRAAAARARRRKRSVSSDVDSGNSVLSPEVASMFDIVTSLEQEAVARHKRSTSEQEKLEQLSADDVFNILCPYVRCPVAAPDRQCTDTSYLDAYIRDRRCLRCATCSDDVTNSDDVTLHHNTLRRSHHHRNNAHRRHHQ